MTQEKENWHGEKIATRTKCPPGRYLLRERQSFASPFEAEIIKWSDGGRVKLRYHSGSESWREKGDIPYVVEKLL